MHVSARDPHYGIYLLCLQDLLIQMRAAQLHPNGVLTEDSCPTTGRRAMINRTEQTHNGDFNITATATAWANKGTTYNCSYF